MKATLESGLCKIGLMVLLIAAVFVGGCPGPMPGVRWAPDEQQKRTRDVAHKVAVATDRHGLPPDTPAGSALVDATLEAMIEAGRPDSPIPLEQLIPQGTADAWQIRRQQVDAYRSKTGLLLKGLKGQVDRITDLATDLSTATEPVSAAEVVRRLEHLAAGAGDSIDLAAGVEVPDSPAVSTAELAAAQAIADRVHEIGQAAAAAAARPVTGTDIAGKVVDEADFWHGQLAPVLAGFGIAIPGVGVAIKKARDAVAARREFEANRRSGAQIVNGVQGILDGPIGKRPITVGEETMTVAELVKGFLAGQDSQTRAFVDAARVEDKG